jgi:hypothetical protein
MGQRYIFFRGQVLMCAVNGWKLVLLCHRLERVGFTRNMSWGGLACELSGFISPDCFLGARVGGSIAATVGSGEAELCGITGVAPAPHGS